MLDLNIQFDASDFITLTKGQLSVLTRSVASKVRAAVKANTPVDSGETRRAWTPVRKTEGGYSFGNPLVQIYSLEYGSRVGKAPWPSPGLRTVYSKGRIYSSQAPQGITAQADVETVANKVAAEVFEKMVTKSAKR